VFWYDAKMKNYLLFLEYIHKNKYAIAKINGVLIVDKIEYLQNVKKIVDQSNNEALKKDINIMLKRELT
jgi:hypothetical protein